MRFHAFEKGVNGFVIPDAFQFSKTRDEVLATLRVEDETSLRARPPAIDVNTKLFL